MLRRFINVKDAGHFSPQCPELRVMFRDIWSSHLRAIDFVFFVGGCPCPKKEAG